jgi:MFS family permease
VEVIAGSSARFSWQRIFAKLRNKWDFRALLVGSSTSMLGSRVTTIAYPMLVLYLTKSAIYAGFSIFAVTAPSILFYMPAGALVDRWNPRRTMLFNELFRGLAVGAIVVIIAFHKKYVILIICLAVIEEILEIFATLAERRYISMLVAPKLAPAAASSAAARVEARSHFVVLIGRPLGAFLFEIDPVVPFCADFVSFIISCLTLIGIREPVPEQAPHEPRARLWMEIKEGLIWLRNNHFFRTAILLNSSMTLISQALILVFIAETESQHLSSLAISIVLACSGFGGVLGAILGEKVSLAIGSCLRFAKGRSRIKLQLCVWSAGMLVLAVTESIATWRLPCMSIVMAIFGFSGAMGNMEVETYITKNVLPAMTARLTSILRLTSFLMFAAGPAIGGILAGCFGTGVAMWCLFAMVMILTAFVVRSAIKRSSLSATQWVLAVSGAERTRSRPASGVENGGTVGPPHDIEAAPDGQPSQEGQPSDQANGRPGQASHRQQVMMK